MDKYSSTYEGLAKEAEGYEKLCGSEIDPRFMDLQIRTLIASNKYFLAEKDVFMNFIQTILLDYKLKDITKINYIVKTKDKEEKTPYIFVEIDTTNFTIVFLEKDKEKLNAEVFDKYNYVVLHQQNIYGEIKTKLYSAPNKELLIDELYINISFNRMHSKVIIPLEKFNL